jgi:hypothetical protein
MEQASEVTISRIICASRSKRDPVEPLIHGFDEITEHVGGHVYLGISEQLLIHAEQHA